MQDVAVHALESLDGGRDGRKGNAESNFAGFSVEYNQTGGARFCEGLDDADVPLVVYGPVSCETAFGAVSPYFATIDWADIDDGIAEAAALQHKQASPIIAGGA